MDDMVGITYIIFEFPHLLTLKMMLDGYGISMDDE